MSKKRDNLCMMDDLMKLKKRISNSDYDGEYFYVDGIVEDLIDILIRIEKQKETRC